MSRKTIKLELKGLKTPRERVWEALLHLHEKVCSFTKDEVQDNCEPMVRWDVVDDYFDDLEAFGYLKREEVASPSKRKVGTPIRFLLAKVEGEAPRLSRGTGKVVTQGSGTEAMWRAMKVLPVFDYMDIARAATLGSLVVKPQTAKSYVLALARADYLIVVKPAKPGTPGRFRLGRNTGPHAPAITRKKVVFDRNTGTSSDLQTAQEVCDGIE